MTNYRLSVRLAIALTFVLIGVGAFQTPVRGAYIFLQDYFNIEFYGALMFLSAIWVLLSTAKEERLNFLSTASFFGYLGGVFALAFFTATHVPPQTIGAYVLSAVTILVEVIRE